jgi:hypothetical protein
MEVKSLWPTDVGFSKFEVDGLFDHIFIKYDLSKSVEVNGGNIFEDKSAVMKKFKKLVYEKFDQYLIKSIDKSISDYSSYDMKAWITGDGKNYNMPKHNHAGSQLSAVFYIMVEEPLSGGEIVFSDPRSNCNRGYDDWFFPLFENFSYSPKSGDCIIFPSFLYHHVNQCYSNLRVCVPVDLYLHRQ